MKRSEEERREAFQRAVYIKRSQGGCLGVDCTHKQPITDLPPGCLIYALWTELKLYQDRYDKTASARLLADAVRVVATDLSEDIP